MSWLTAARGAATSIVAHAHSVAPKAVRQFRSAAASLGNALAEALDAIGDAARTFAQGTPNAPPRPTDWPGQGLEWLTTRRLTECLGVAVGAIYRHVTSTTSCWESSPTGSSPRRR